MSILYTASHSGQITADNTVFTIRSQKEHLTLCLLCIAKSNLKTTQSENTEDISFKMRKSKQSIQIRMYFQQTMNTHETCFLLNYITIQPLRLSEGS